MIKEKVLTLLAEIERCQTLVAMSPDDYPFQTRAGMAMAARQAKDSLVELQREYVEMLQAQSVTLALAGPQDHVAEFVRLARTEGVVLIASVNDFYEKLANRIELGIAASRLWNVNEYALTIQLALNEAVDLGIVDATHDTRKPFSNRVVPDHTAVVDAVRETVRERLGDEIPCTTLRTILRQTALREKVVPEKAIPVLLVGARDTAEATAMLAGWPSPSGVVVEVMTPPTVEAVVRCFRKAKKK